MDKIMEFLNLIVFHTLEIIEAIGEIAGQISDIHFPTV